MQLVQSPSKNLTLRSIQPKLSTSRSNISKIESNVSADNLMKTAIIEALQKVTDIHAQNILTPLLENLKTTQVNLFCF